MFCKVCGKEINDEAVICPHCGCSVKEIPVTAVDNGVAGEKKKVNAMSITGFVLSLVSLLIALFGTVAVVGLILSIIGLVQCNQKGERLKGLAIAGIIVSAASLLYTVIVLVYGMTFLY